jgi:hypothetical protein
MIFGMPVSDAVANGHQVARLFDPPAHGLGAGIALVEIDEAFVAQAGALPDAERRIDDDRRWVKPFSSAVT